MPRLAFATIPALYLLAGALAPAPIAAAPAAQGAVDVSALDFRFEPTRMMVAPGTTIRWLNRGGSPHTTTADGGLWDSGTLAPGSTFSFTFDTPGTYAYFCRIHPSMRGAFRVKK